MSIFGVFFDMTCSFNENTLDCLGRITVGGVLILHQGVRLDNLALQALYRLPQELL
jgi:hypothetical protein